MPDARGRFMKGEHWRPPQPFREREYLEREYVERQRSAAEIGSDFGVGAQAIQFWLKKHSIPGRSISEARRVKRWGSPGEANPMYGKRGAEVPSWKGGVTPERQAFYSRPEWTAAVDAVRIRDGNRCRRCERVVDGRRRHIHHVATFAAVELRANPAYLVVLCSTCHGFVHSKRNVNGEFMKKGGDV